ncbi:MAG TPA: hypothetical protein VGE45_09925 [Chloroflexia bacterium]
MSLSRLIGGKQASPLLLALLLVLTLLGVVVAYQSSTSSTIFVGEPGDGAFLSGFYSDEADIDYRYRWTNGRGEVEFKGVGSSTPDLGIVTVRAQGPTLSGSSAPITMSVSVNGSEPYLPGVVTVTSELLDYSFYSPTGTGTCMEANAPCRVAITSSTFRPPGDARILGVKIDRVELSQSGEGGLRFPSVLLVLWLLALVAGLYGAARSIQGLPGLIALALILIILGVVLVFFASDLRSYITAYLPPVAAVAGMSGLLAWQRHRIWRWPQAIDALGKGRLAAGVLLGATLLYAGLSLWVIAQNDWIGHADYAENAVVARNFVAGRGLTVDYVAQFYREHPGISHPAETWPLLQPLMIAPFFAAFGPQTWAAKLPNLFVMVGLVWAVFVAASRLWDARVGLLAGLLTLAHPYFFNSVLYPINDLGFTAIFFVLAWLVWRPLSPYAQGGMVTSNGVGSARPASPATKVAGNAHEVALRRLPSSIESAKADFVPVARDFSRRAINRRLVAIGALAGLLIWSKPSGAILLLGLGLWALWTWWRWHRPAKSLMPWRALLVTGGVAALVVLPLLIRNLLAFGTPFFSTEGLDAWILRYWPYYDWENIYKVYISSSDPPHPRWIVGGKFGYQNLFDAISINFRWVWQKGVISDPDQPDFVIGLVPLLGAVVGLSALTRRVGSLFGMVGLSTGLYALFVLLYWHFEGRYFQVLMPWLYMLLAWGIFWLWDRLRETLREGIGRRWGLLLLPLAVAGFLLPPVSMILDQAEREVPPTGFVSTMEWLRQNSAEQDVVMTRDPWELNWHTGRKAVMIPNDDLPTIKRIARQYGVTMLQLGGPVDRVDVDRCPDGTNPQGPFPTGSRPALGGLYCGLEMPGYDIIFKDGRGGTIYRVSPER